MFDKLRFLSRFLVTGRGITSSATLLRMRTDRKSILANVPATDEGADGERNVDIDATTASVSFPDLSTPDTLIDGVRFAQLHVCHVIVSKNNTKLYLTDSRGRFVTTWSAGCEGFRNAKRGTNIAAQAAAITLATRVAGLGIKNVRVKIGGLGPGRTASIKGLMMGGLDVVSISDTTPAPIRGPRPRKQRRL